MRSFVSDNAVLWAEADLLHIERKQLQDDLQEDDDDDEDINEEDELDLNIGDDGEISPYFGRFTLIFDIDDIYDDDTAIRAIMAREVIDF